MPAGWNGPASRRPASPAAALATKVGDGKPRGGEAGAVIEPPTGRASDQEPLAMNVFRPGVAPAGSRHRIWPLVLLVASLLFVGDILCRRVLVTFDWLPRLADRLPWRRAALAAVPSQPIKRLKRSKAAISAKIERKSARADLGEFVDAPLLAERAQPIAPAATPTSSPQQQPLATDSEADSASYTSRLLAAKQRARDERRAD